MTVIELREKRAKLWATMEGFLDTHRNDKGVLSAEDDATYRRTCVRRGYVTRHIIHRRFIAKNDLQGGDDKDERKNKPKGVRRTQADVFFKTVKDNEEVPHGKIQIGHPPEYPHEREQRGGYAENDRQCQKKAKRDRFFFVPLKKIVHFVHLPK